MRVNRTQALVLGFFLMALASLVVILIAAPEVYDQALRLPSDSPRWMALTFLAALAVFIGLLALGVVRRWHWTFCRWGAVDAEDDLGGLHEHRDRPTVGDSKALGGGTGDRRHDVLAGDIHGDLCHHRAQLYVVDGALTGG